MVSDEVSKDWEAMDEYEATMTRKQVKLFEKLCDMRNQVEKLEGCIGINRTKSNDPEADEILGHGFLDLEKEASAIQGHIEELQHQIAIRKAQVRFPDSFSTPENTTDTEKPRIGICSSIKYTTELVTMFLFWIVRAALFSAGKMNARNVERTSLAQGKDAAAPSDDMTIA